MSFSFVTIHACYRQTDRRTELRLPRPTLAYARAVKMLLGIAFVATRTTIGLLTYKYALPEVIICLSFEFTGRDICDIPSHYAGFD